jgi:hypothetical protein
MPSFWRKTFGIGPDAAGRVRRPQEIADRQAAEAATQNPYGPNAPQWDENGFPVGPMPRGKYALDYQYEANRRAEEQRRTLWGDAQNTMRQGLDLFQSYRPGGSAALASGMFGQKANLYGTQAMNTEAPDLLIDWREQIRKRAEEKQNQLNRNSQLITGLSAFNILGGTAAPLASGGPAQPTATDNRSMAPGGNVGEGSAAGAQAGLQGGYDTAGGAAQGAAAGGIGGMPMNLGGAAQGASAGGLGGLPSMLQGEGGGGGGGMGGGAPGSQRAGGGGKGQGPGGADFGGATAMGAPLTTFSGPEVATRSMAQAPGSVDTTTSMWAEDPLREQSTALRVQSARSRLLTAMAG